MILASEKLVAYELCSRRFKWMSQYPVRVSLVRALYIALDAGLRTAKDPERVAENEFLSIAASPGLDVIGQDVYAIAMHHAKLAGILAAALRSAWTAPWEILDPVALPDGHQWHSAVYDAGDGNLRRLALVDRWSDDRKQQELSGWRTVGEVCALDRPLLLTAVTIGTSHEKRRHSAWTRCWRHPRNHTFRFQRKNSTEDFNGAWASVWREDAGITTSSWLTQMRADGAVADLVHTLQVPVPRGREAYLDEMKRLAGEMATLPEVPGMRLAGCYGFAPCPFLNICPGAKPEKYGFSKFQSTLPARGATRAITLLSQSEKVSIHAPRAGSDLDVPPLQRSRRGVSIHAPRAGSDMLISGAMLQPPCFNPRSPRGERLVSSDSG